MKDEAELRALRAHIDECLKRIADEPACAKHGREHLQACDAEHCGVVWCVYCYGSCHCENDE